MISNGIVGSCVFNANVIAMQIALLRREWKEIFVSLGDTLNNQTIWTNKTPDGKSGAPFDAQTILITMADKGIDARVRVTTKAAGYPLSIMNTDLIPAPRTGRC